MALAEIFQAFASQFVADETVRFGEKALKEHDSPPKVTFIPGSFTYQGSAGLSRLPKSIATRRHRVDIVCWAADQNDTSAEAQLTELELLADTVVWALHRCAQGSYELGTGEMIDDSVNDFGRSLVIPVFFHIPVVEAAATRRGRLAPITDVSTGANVPAVGVPPAVTGVAVFGQTGDETEVEGSPAP